MISTENKTNLNKTNDSTEEQKKTDLIIQVKPTIVKDNYSGIDKQYYHEDAEGTLEMGAKKRQY